MTTPQVRHSVDSVVTVRVPGQLAPAIIRPRDQVEAVLEQSLQDMGGKGRTALAWQWVLTGAGPSPVTRSLSPGRTPSREEILAEADAEPEGSTAPPGVPADFCDQLEEARRVLAWLTGASDEIPVDDDNRGRFIGARDDYSRTDDTIRQVRAYAVRGLHAFDLPDPMDPGDAQRPWRWAASWMNAAWLRGVRDLLTWILGEHATSPLCGRTVGTPTAYDLTYDDAAADDVVTQGRPGGLPVDPSTYPPPQYGEGIKATIRWLRGEDTTPPITNEGCSPYARDHHRADQDGSC